MHLIPLGAIGVTPPDVLVKTHAIFPCLLVSDVTVDLGRTLTAWPKCARGGGGPPVARDHAFAYVNGDETHNSYSPRPAPKKNRTSG